MRVYPIYNFHDLIKIREIWNRVLGESNSNSPFLTMEWLTSWWKAFGQRKELLILLAYDETSDVPCGISPLMIRKSGVFKIIEFVGTGNSDHLDFIIKDKDEEVVHSFFMFLNAKQNTWDLIYIRDMLCSSKNIPHILKEAKKMGWLALMHPAASYPYLQITEDWQKFVSTKSSNFRYTLKRYEKRLKKEGPLFHVEQKGTLDFDSRVLNDIADIEKRSWKAGTPAARLQFPKVRAFYFSFMKDFALNGWLNLWVGYMGEKPVAYLINFDYGNKIWFYNSAYDERFSRMGIGSIIHYLAIKDAFFKGKTEYDFLKGGEMFKKRWASKSRQSMHLLLMKKSIRSFLGYIVIFQIGKVLKKLKIYRNLIPLLRPLNPH